MKQYEATPMNKTDAGKVIAAILADTATTQRDEADPNGLVTLIQMTLGNWIAVVLGEVKTNARIADQNIPVQIVYGAHRKAVDMARAVLVAVVHAAWTTEKYRVEYESHTKHVINALFEAIADVPAFCNDILLMTYRTSIDPKTGLENMARFQPITQVVTALNGAYKAGPASAIMQSLDDVLLDDYLKPSKKDLSGTTLFGFLKSGNPDLKLIGDAEPIDHAEQAANLADILSGITNKT